MPSTRRTRIASPPGSNSRANRSGRIRTTSDTATITKNSSSRLAAVRKTPTQPPNPPVVPSNTNITTNPAILQPQTSTTNPTVQQPRQRNLRNKSTKRPIVKNQDTESEHDLSDTFKPSDEESASNEDEPRSSNQHRPSAKKRPRHQGEPTGSQNVTTTTNSTTPDPALIDGFVPSGVDIDLPTVSNYKLLASEWPDTRISGYLNQSRKKFGTVVPQHIRDEAEALKKLYHHHKEMLAMMANVSSFTLDKAIGDLGSTRGVGADGYRLWMSYSKFVEKEYMPRSTEGTSLAQRNKIIGEKWTSLSEMEKMVYEPSIFYTLSGLPSPKKYQLFPLTPDERDELQTLYDESVSNAKVTKAYALISAGTSQGQTLADHNRLSRKRVEKLHSEIQNESTRMNFAYYFLVAGTHAKTSESKESDGWCLEFTSHQEMAEYVSTKSNFPVIFAARTQGASVEEAIASAIGPKSKPNLPKPKQAADVVKSKLSSALRSQLAAVIGHDPSQGFPHKPNPAQRLKDKGYKVKIVQLEGSSLKPEDLLLGFDKMNSKRSLWLKDLEAGLFKLEKDEEPDGGSDNGGIVNMPDIEGEEEEWGGISHSHELLEASVSHNTELSIEDDDGDLPDVPIGDK